MPRSLTGSCKPLGDGLWQVGVPVARGATKRRTATFAEESQAEAWQAACRRALEAGTELPDPAAFRPTSIRRRYVAPDHPVTVREYAHSWHRRLYEVNHRARGDRTRQVRADLDNHIINFFDAVGIKRLEDITPQAATDLARYLGGWPLEYHEACRPKKIPLVRNTATRVVGLFRNLMAAAVAEGHLARDPSVFVRAMRRYGGDKSLPAGPPLTLEDAVQMAVLLAPIHQLALWLMRLLGLRIGEVFGPRVRDVIDNGHQMLLLIKEQGGRVFEERDEYGKWVRSTESPTLKTKESYRVMPVPACLAELIHIVIDAYHTDPDTGAVDVDARLIPGVQHADVSEMHNLRARLQKAAAATGIRDPEGAHGRLRPHQLRGAAATDIHVREDAIQTLQQRFLGHRAGDTVLLRHYLLDDPESRGLLAIRDAIEADVRERVGDLIVPTTAEGQWGLDNPMRDRLGYVDTVLSACGWRATDTDDGWLSSAKVASMLGIHPSKARERMADGRIPATLRKWGTRDCWFARRSEVEAYQRQSMHGTTVEELATQLGLSYHQAYQGLQRLGVAPERPTGRRLQLTDEQVEAVTREQERIRALHTRAVRVTEAARMLNRRERTVRGYLAANALEVDPETDSSGARFVTRASIQRLLDERASEVKVASQGDTLSYAEVSALTGLKRRQLSDLVQVGHLVTVHAGRETAIPLESLHVWATGFRPDLLPQLKGRGRTAA